MKNIFPFFGRGKVVANVNASAIDFDGSTEIMANTTAQAIGIANAWSIAVWLKIGSGSHNRMIEIAAVAGFGGNCPINIGDLTSSGKMEVYIQGPAANNNKLWKGNTSYNTDGTTKQHYVFTWDGTNFAIYRNGTADTPYNKTFVDGAPTQTDESRKVAIGGYANNTGNSNIIVNRLTLWNTVISAGSITSLYDSGNGWSTKDPLLEADSAAVKHDWLPGKSVSPNLGKDYGASAINIETNAVNISDADRVTF